MTDPQSFYDRFADAYHLIFKDWAAAVVWQSEAIDALLRQTLGAGPHTLLDCACGIGTQALGLAQRGHTVTGTDISPQSIERAVREAAAMGVTARFLPADMRDLGAALDDRYDAVLAFDNALPHLLTDADLDRAAASIYGRVRPGGAFLASIRDYDALLAERPRVTGGRVIETPEGRRVALQLWDWSDDDSYTVTQFILTPDGDDWTTQHFTGRYRALRRDTLTAALARAGFRDVRWLAPDDSGYYQPVVVAIP
jgi:glycine/sarcosine N-methyltransferase